MDNVLTIFEGLTYTQARALRALAIPVLSELRSCVVAGEPRLVIDLAAVLKGYKMSENVTLNKQKECTK